MSSTRNRGQSLRIDLLEGAAQDRPRIAAAFLIYFDVKAGYTISWKRSITGDCGVNERAVELEGVVEFKSLPSGLHNVKEDLVYFVHGQYAGISAFVNEPAAVSERNALMLAVGVLVPLSYGRLGRGWRHAHGLKDLAKLLAEDTARTQPLEDFWEAHRISDNDASIRPESPVGSPSSLQLRPIRKQLTNGNVRNRNISDATALESPSPTLSPFHPALSLPNFLETFGPLVFPLYKAALLRKRILLIGQAPVELTCNYVYDLSIISNIPTPVHNLLSIGTYHTRLRPLFAVGVHDIPILEHNAQGHVDTHPTNWAVDDEESESEGNGWIACSTDDVLAMKSRLYDVLVTMPPAYSKQAKEKVWPKVESPQGSDVKATQRDLRRYRTLQRGLRRHQTDGRYLPFDADNHDEEDTLLAQVTQETYNDALFTSDEKLIEPMSWPALAYSSFIWWASAGEKRADLDEEMERDVSLLDDLFAIHTSPSERSHSKRRSSNDRNPEDIRTVMPEMAVIAYFHRLTTSIFSTLADIIDSSNDDDGTGVEDEVLTVSSEDMARMGLDMWSDGDRKFVENLMEMYFGRKADVQGAKVECCGVRIC
ncbi:MAG: hypothetical protein M1830_005034 [Pleopsidium flavum]|nr:MAG: hypothetical protein M1830_005034 [Pleopsidium flavum]